MTSGIENGARFRSPGVVSLWLTTTPLEGIPHGFLDGGAALFAWLDVDYGVTISGEFASDYSEDGQLCPVGVITARLPFAPAFAAEVVARCGIEHASFVLALYDCAYDPEVAGTVGHDCAFLRFGGAYRYQ